MKHVSVFYWVVTFLVVTLFAVSCSREESTSGTSFSEDVVEGDVSKAIAHLEIEGMSCEIGCARYIRGKLAKLEGVSESEVFFEKGIAKISYDPGIISGKELVSHIEGLNDGQYKVVKAEIEKTIKKGISLEENPSGNKTSNEKTEDVVISEPGFKSIAFPDIFNAFKFNY